MFDKKWKKSKSPVDLVSDFRFDIIMSSTTSTVLPPIMSTLSTTIGSVVTETLATLLITTNGNNGSLPAEVQPSTLDMSSYTVDDGDNLFDDDSAFISPLIDGLLFAIPCSIIMLFTIVGNILVIVSVFNYKPLRNVQNMYLVSLAVADITVATFVMPFNVTYSIMGRWIFGLIMCKMWLTSDVLCCTASILNLCAIALDRYQAIHDPINYAQKRTLQRVLTMIGLIWIISGLISVPPLLGWNDWPDDFSQSTPCTLTQERGYVVYSSSGSFFIPLVIMTVVYIKIFAATRRRLREKAKLTAGRVSVKVRATLPSSSDVDVVRASTSSDNQVTEGGDNITMTCTTMSNNNGANNSSSKKEFTVENSDSSGDVEESEYVTEYTSRTATNSSKSAIFNDPESGLVCETNLSIVTNMPTSIMKASGGGGGVGGGCLSPMTLAPESALTGGSGSCHKKSNRMKKLKINSTKHHHNQQDKKRKSDGNGSGKSGKKVGIQPEPVSQVKQYWEEKQRISLSRERKAARVLGIVMGIFTLCWLPFFLMYVILPFCGEDSCPMPRWAENFITWLGYINSALNPIIYTIFNMDFRRAFKRILCCDQRARRAAPGGRGAVGGKTRR